MILGHLKIFHFSLAVCCVCFFRYVDNSAYRLLLQCPFQTAVDETSPFSAQSTWTIDDVTFHLHMLETDSSLSMKSHVQF